MKDMYDYKDLVKEYKNDKYFIKAPFGGLGQIMDWLYQENE